MIAIIINQCHCHQILYIGYFIDNCVKIPNYQCQPSGTEPTPTTPQPTTINGNGLGPGDIAAIVFGSMFVIVIIAAAIIVPVIIIIIWQCRRQCNNGNVMPCTQCNNKEKSN